MKTMADVRRLVKPGLVFQCVNYIHPEVSGRRTVVRAQVKSFSYEVDAADKKIGWIEYPKAGEYRIDGNELIFLYAGEPAFRFIFGEAEA